MRRWFRCLLEVWGWDRGGRGSSGHFIGCWAFKAIKVSGCRRFFWEIFMCCFACLLVVRRKINNVEAKAAHKILYVYPGIELNSFLMCCHCSWLPAAASFAGLCFVCVLWYEINLAIDHQSGTTSIMHPCSINNLYLHQVAHLLDGFCGDLVILPVSALQHTICMCLLAYACIWPSELLANHIPKDFFFLY